MYGWDGEEVVPIGEELLRSPKALLPEMSAQEHGASAAAGPEPTLDRAAGIARPDDDEEEEEDEGEDKNWRRPKQDTDFAAHAGRAEKAALQRLGFNLLLDGREIGASHGIDAKGRMTPDALRAVGIRRYQDLWCTDYGAGKVVEKAEEMLRGQQVSTGARDKVREARGDLEEAVFYRQLDIMAFRLQPQYTPQWVEHKKKLLARGRRAIVEEYERDWEDRGRLQAVDGARRRELESACQGHVKELDMRYNTLYELDRILS